MFRKLLKWFRYNGRKGMKMMFVPSVLPEYPVLAALVRHANGHKVAVVVLTDYQPLDVMGNHALRSEIAGDALMVLPDSIMHTFGADVLECAMEAIPNGSRLEHVGNLNVSPN